MKNITAFRTFYLPSGRIIVSKTEDGHLIESTEMRDVSVEGKNHSEVRETFDPKVIWNHLVPVTKKWLLTVSTQVGCTYKCKFCDVANLGFKRNLTRFEILDQIEMLINSTPEILKEGTEKAKIGFARMGEPMQNLINVLGAMRDLRTFSDKINWLPCFNSIVPKKVALANETISGLEALDMIICEKEISHNGRMHIQISVNSTDEAKRQELFNGADVTPLKDIIDFVNSKKITNRTVTLNFICMKDVEIDIKKLMDYGLNAEKFAVKIIPLNATLNAEKNRLETEFNYSNLSRMEELEGQFQYAGIPVVADAIAKCEEAGLCCGQLVREYWQ